MDLTVLTNQAVWETLTHRKDNYLQNYLAFYSSIYNGITTNPTLMVLPIDDHMVHRGDGVFEAMKAIDRGIFLMDEHLQRLFLSAKSVGMNCPYSSNEIKEIILQTARVANYSDIMVRLYLSRGPGSFSTNPYDVIKTQLYIVITKFKFYPEEKYQTGVKVGKSEIQVKDSWMAQVKSCNYLPNVMMNKEAVDKKVDFVIGIDDEGCVTESATENLLIIDKNGKLVHPAFDFILKGTTMTRLCELARAHNMPTEARPILAEELQSASEVFLCGTTIDVLPVVQFENQKIANGEPGPICKRLNTLLKNDARHGPCRTVF